MPLSEADLDHVIELARLTVAEEDRVALREDLEKLLDFVAQLQQLDVAGAPPMLRPAELEDALRDDQLAPGLPKGALAELAPELDEGRLRVPRTIDPDA